MFYLEVCNQVTCVRSYPSQCDKTSSGPEVSNTTEKTVSFGGSVIGEIYCVVFAERGVGRWNRGVNRVGTL
jgi:hypothetical protein